MCTPGWLFALGKNTLLFTISGGHPEPGCASRIREAPDVKASEWKTWFTQMPPGQEAGLREDPCGQTMAGDACTTT